MFSGIPGRIVELSDSLESFQTLLSGGGDDYPEQAFYMVGGLKEAFDKARRIDESL